MLETKTVFVPVLVEERLPNRGKVVLVVNDDNNKHLCYLGIRKGVPSGVWMFAQKDGKYDCSKITHWFEEKEAIVLTPEELRNIMTEFAKQLPVYLNKGHSIKSALDIYHKELKEKV